MEISSFYGTGNYTKTFTDPQYWIEVYNDDENVTLIAAVGNDTYEILPQERFYDTVEDFTTVTITTTGAWRFITKAKEYILNANVNPLISSIRYGLGDKMKVRYSDYEIIEGINVILRLVNLHLATTRSNVIFVPDYEVTLVNRSANLPVDFFSIANVFDSTGQEIGNTQYRITQDEIIYVGENETETKLILWYYRKLNDWQTGTETLDLPDSFFELVKANVVMLLNKKISPFEQMYMRQLAYNINAISCSRDISYIDREMPFIV